MTDSSTTNPSSTVNNTGITAPKVPSGVQLIPKALALIHSPHQSSNATNMSEPALASGQATPLQLSSPKSRATAPSLLAKGGNH